MLIEFYENDEFVAERDINIPVNLTTVDEIWEWLVDPDNAEQWDKFPSPLSGALFAGQLNFKII